MSLLPTITEVQESSASRVCHAHSATLEDYLDSMRVLSQHPPWYAHGTTHTTTITTTATAALHHQPCRQLAARMPTPRQAKYPIMASLSSSSLPAPSSPPPCVSTDPSLALALVAVGPESISLTLAEVPTLAMSPQQTQPSDGRAWWWPHQDPLGWLFTQSQGEAAVGSAPMPLGESVPDAVCLI